MTEQEKEEALEVGTVDPELQLLYDHIKLKFIANANKIADSQKPETLLKMIQSCKEIQPVDNSQKELWQIVQKVRQELLTRKNDALGKISTVRCRKTRKQHEPK